MRLNRKQIIEKAKQIIIDNQLLNFTDLLNYDFTHYVLYKKFKLQKNEELIDLIAKINKESKEIFKQENQDVKEIYLKKAKEFLNQTENHNGKNHYTNFTVTSTNSLSIELGILPAKFRKLELNKDENIKFLLERNRSFNLKNAKIKLHNNTDTSAAIIMMKIYGDDDLRQKLSTNWNVNDNTNETDLSITVATDDESKKLKDFLEGLKKDEGN